MNKDRIKEWLGSVISGKWTNGDGTLVNIAHSKFLNIEGTMCDFYLEKNNKKWSDYLLENSDMIEFKKKYDKYITEKSIDKEKLLTETYDWFDLNRDFLDCVDSKEGFFHSAYQIKLKIEKMNVL